LSLWNQLWAPPRQDALQKGDDAIQKAVALGAKSERQRDYINAVAKFYADSDKLDHRTRARVSRQLESLKGQAVERQLAFWYI